jgi:glycerol-3-phosphate acyltransferase PlsY
VNEVAPVAGVVLGAVVLLAGYLVGALRTSGRIARMAGVDLPVAGGSDPGVAAVWRVAGPGWGFLALTAELAKGVLPVAVGIVTFGWAIGWVAGLGALLGACWPGLGRAPGGRGLATFGGVAFTLAPPAGALSVLVALAIFGIGRVAGRDARRVALAAGFGSYPLLFPAVEPDAGRFAAVLVLGLVLLLRLVTFRRG